VVFCLILLIDSFNLETQLLFHCSGLFCGLWLHVRDIIVLSHNWVPPFGAVLSIGLLQGRKFTDHIIERGRYRQLYVKVFGRFAAQIGRELLEHASHGLGLILDLFD
jgi:hypothetical protein